MRNATIHAGLKAARCHSGKIGHVPASWPRPRPLAAHATGALPERVVTVARRGRRALHGAALAGSSMMETGHDRWQICPWGSAYLSVH
jgi:hypothetical protein